jgi:hypothetical protein
MRECQYTLGFIMLEASTPLLEDSRSSDKRLFVDTQLHCFVASRSIRPWSWCECRVSPGLRVLSSLRPLKVSCYRLEGGT